MVEGRFMKSTRGRVCMMLVLVSAVVVLLTFRSTELHSLRDLNAADWPAFDRIIADELPDSIEGESVSAWVLRSQTARTVYDRGTPELWLSMCESGEPRVSVLEFRCIQDKAPEESFRAALNVVARRQVGGGGSFF